MSNGNITLWELPQNLAEPMPTEPVKSCASSASCLPARASSPPASQLLSLMARLPACLPVRTPRFYTMSWPDLLAMSGRLELDQQRLVASAAPAFARSCGPAQVRATEAA